MILFGLVLLAIGLAHYAGRTKSWSRDSVLTPYTFLGFAWLGAGALLVGIATGLRAADAFDVLIQTVTAVGAASWFVGFVGLFWLPSPLRPAWMKERRRERVSTSGEPAPSSPAATLPADRDAGDVLPAREVMRAREPLSGASIPVPDGWAVTEQAGQVAVVGPPSSATAAGEQFRPNITLLASTTDGIGDVRDAGAAALAAAPVAAENAHVLAYELCDVPGARDARRLQLVYSQGEIDVDVVQVVAVTDQHAVTVTASRAVAQHVDVRHAVDHALAGLTIGTRA